MKSTGDKIIDLLLKQFREQVRPKVLRGSPVDIATSLESAIYKNRYDFLKQHISDKDLREHIKSNEELIHHECRKIIYEMEKRDRLQDIRKTSVEVVMEDFVRQSPYEITYSIRGNSTVGISVVIPSSGQSLIFNSSFKKILSDGWIGSTIKNIDDFITISGRFGRIRITRG